MGAKAIKANVAFSAHVFGPKAQTTTFRGYAILILQLDATVREKQMRSLCRVVFNWPLLQNPCSCMSCLVSCRFFAASYCQRCRHNFLSVPVIVFMCWVGIIGRRGKRSIKASTAKTASVTPRTKTTTASKQFKLVIEMVAQSVTAGFPGGMVPRASLVKLCTDVNYTNRSIASRPI